MAAQALTYDRVLEAPTVTGTGAVQFTGTAVTGGYRSWTSTVPNGQSTYYTIQDTTGSAFEVGFDAYNSGSNQMPRTAGNVLSGSSGPGVLVNFAGNACQVFADAPAAALNSAFNASAQSSFVLAAACIGLAPVRGIF